MLFARWCLTTILRDLFKNVRHFYKLSKRNIILISCLCHHCVKMEPAIGFLYSLLENPVFNFLKVNFFLDFSIFLTFDIGCGLMNPKEKLLLFFLHSRLDLYVCLIFMYWILEMSIRCFALVCCETVYAVYPTYICSCMF